MPWNGSGVFTRDYSWLADAAANIDITASRMDTDTDDITANGLGNCITRDGQGVPTQNLPMAGFHHTGASAGVASTDYATLGQSQGGKINWIVAGGSADVITATYSPAIASLVDGALCFLRASAANATTTPTFAPNGLTASAITKAGGSALAAGDIPAALAEIILRYNLANTRWELLNPAAPATLPPSGIAAGDLGGTYPNPTVVATHLASALPIAQGGTSATTATAALSALLSAAPLPIASGGTAAITAVAALTALGAAPLATFTTGQVLAGTGSQSLPGGLIIKWGTATGTYNSFATISFAVAFPNNCFVVVATPLSSSALDFIGVGNFTAASFGLASLGSVNAPLNASWIAIGN